MAFKEVQKDVDDWTNQYKYPYWQPLEILARLTEETGELARELNHMFGAKKKKPTEDKKELSLEIADVIFTLFCLANSQGINLDEAWKGTMDKCYGRDKDRYEKKESANPPLATSINPQNQAENNNSITPILETSINPLSLAETSSHTNTKELT